MYPILSSKNTALTYVDGACSSYLCVQVWYSQQLTQSLIEPKMEGRKFNIYQASIRSLSNKEPSTNPLGLELL